jgi:hypothetical protein
MKPCRLKLQLIGWLLLVLLAPIAPAATESNSRGFVPIDLSRFITTAWYDFHPWVSWNGPPGGLQCLDDVPFQIDGVAQFRALNPRAPGEVMPTRVEKIPVGRPFTQIHLLHCSEFSAPPGQPVVKVILHYHDDKTHEFVLCYGFHFQDWNHPLPPYAAAESSSPYAWIAPAAGNQGPPWVSALWHTALVNPRPATEVVSLEVRSLFSQARYTLLALTTENGPAPKSVQTENVIPSAKEPTLCRFQLLDAKDGGPIPDVRVQASVRMNNQAVRWETVGTDSRGEAMLSFPPCTPAKPMELLATAPKHITAKFSLTIDPHSIPSLKMRRGRTVGGRVVDESGRPVTGASVTVAGPQVDEEGQSFIAKWFTAVTDTNGVWTLDCAPPEFSRLIITIHTSKLLPAVIYEQDDTAGSPLSFRGGDLALRQAVFRVNPGIECKGAVRCAAGPVSGAQVTLFCGDSPQSMRFSARTDKEGQFVFPGLETGPGTMVVVADGFTPVLQKLQITTNAVAITLDRGRTLQVVARGASGGPLGQTLFQVTSWKGGPWLGYFGYSDAAGEFRWKSAPSDPVIFSVFHPGYRDLQDVSLSPDAAPKVLILQRQN